MVGASVRLRGFHCMAADVLLWWHSLEYPLFRGLTLTCMGGRSCLRPIGRRWVPVLVASLVLAGSLPVRSGLTHRPSQGTHKEWRRA